MNVYYIRSLTNCFRKERSTIQSLVLNQIPKVLFYVVIQQFCFELHEMKRPFSSLFKC
jgi:hypothetical protein